MKDICLYNEQFVNAQPFPHVVIDGMWDAARLDTIVAEFPGLYDARWQTYPSPQEWGKRSADARTWGPETVAWYREMRSKETCAKLEALTDIGPLTADDLGGGYHMTSEGGRLEMHTDFNLHPGNHTLERRINFLLFLNHNWEKEWGGVLYLGAGREVEIIPEFNRTVIFETSNVSFHGHPEPVIGWHHRRSLAVYYYAATREGAKSQSTVWHA